MTLCHRLCIAALFALTGGSAAGAFTLDILHFNDLHSRIEPVNDLDGKCSAADIEADACYGGVARLFTAIQSLRRQITEAGGHPLVLDAGDNWQGSLYFTAYSGEAELEMLNAMEIDAMTVGNHEFDLGVEPLAEFAAGANFPVLFGNADVSGEGSLARLLKEPLILETGGERVAVLAAVTEETPEISTPGPTVTFSGTVAYLEDMVARVEGQGVDKILLLSHVGATEDIRIAGTVAGIDAIIGGHSHTIFANENREAAYPYPLMVDGPDGASVPVVQAGALGKYLGHLTLDFDDGGQVTSARGDLMLLDGSVEPHPSVLDRVRELEKPIAELKARVVGRLAAQVDGKAASCRAGECAMGNLVADAMLDRVRRQGVSIAIQNAGGLRASLPAGDVTMSDILTVLPFQNTLATFNLRGSGIRAALENGVSRREPEASRFPQVAGLRFTWDPAAEPGKRIMDVQVRDRDTWAPLEPDKVYSIVTNSFLRGGGDGYTIFAENGRNAYDYGPGLDEVLADFLAARPDYEPVVDGRIARAE